MRCVASVQTFVASVELRFEVAPFEHIIDAVMGIAAAAENGGAES